MSLYPLTREHYFTLHGATSDPELLENADEVLRLVNVLIEFAALDGVKIAVDQLSHNHVASGFRPPGANAKTSNAATGSKHLTCLAVDVQDSLDGKRQLAVWCIQNLDVLERLGLYMEDPRWTGGRTNTDPWVHLQIVPPGSGKRVYIPYKDQVKNPAQDPTFYTRFGLKVP